ncbi:hypothetical protein AAZX31_02G246400 [Glycine max]
MGFAVGEFPVNSIAFSSFVIVFWFNFCSHVPQSLTTLLSSCFGCATLPSVAPLSPLPLSRSRIAGQRRRTTLRGGSPSLASFWDLSHLGLFQPCCLNAGWAGSS